MWRQTVIHLYLYAVAAEKAMAQAEQVAKRADDEAEQENQEPGEWFMRKIKQACQCVWKLPSLLYDSD